MSRLEEAITAIVELFVEYANGDGELSINELKNMFEKEIQTPELKVRMSVADFNKAMGRLDKDNNGAADFKEFLIGVSAMCMSVYHKKTGLGQACED